MRNYDVILFDLDGTLTFSAPGIEQNNLALYFNISPVILIMSVLAVYLALQLISRLLGRPRP